MPSKACRATSGIFSASLNGVMNSASWLWNTVMLLIRLAMISEMPTDEPMLRISVHSAAPSVRNSRGQRREGDGVERHEHQSEADALDDAVDDDRRSPNVLASSRPSHRARRSRASARCTIRMRASTLPSRRPTAIIAKNVPMPRAPSRKPLASTG